MKNIFQKLTLLMIPALLVGCSSVNPTADSSSKSGDKSSSSSTSAAHVHKWSTTWSKDGINHWHDCQSSTCDEVNDLAPHDFGAWQTISSVENLPAEQKYAFANVKRKRACQTCGYEELDGTNILPVLKFNTTNQNGISFATTATKNDLTRPEVRGKFTLTNCDQSMAFENVDGTMKVRGNQTAGWSKKAFRMKFDDKRNVLGLSKGGKYKKWVLLADAKDTTLIRSALGLGLSKAVCEGDNVWVSDYTPVSVYLNDQYWGFYYLADQKEVKPDGSKKRINLPEVEEGYKGVDIGYCFELDHYADSAGASDEASEMKKGADGDPTFRIKYNPSLSQGNPSNQNSGAPLATGQVFTYTLLSDITDGPANEHVQADYSRVNNQGKPDDNATKTSNSNQLTFIRNKVEKLYEILYYVSHGQAKELDSNDQVVNSSKSIEEIVRQYFDVDAWVDGVIINAYSCPPDLGYSSFYMAYDNSPDGDKKLRFECPWDFDSNFANRNNFYVNGNEGLYVDCTYNTWLYSLYKLDFFKEAVKAKWNALREAEVFEDMFHEMRTSFTNYDAEIHRNHYRWPQNDAAHQPPNNFNEIRNPYKDPAQYKQAEEETIRWCAARVDYIESQWGTGRPNVNTNK